MADPRSAPGADRRNDGAHQGDQKVLELLEHLVDRMAALEVNVAKVVRQQALIMGNVPILREVLGDHVVRQLLEQHKQDVRGQAAVISGGVAAWRNARPRKRRA